MPACVTSEAVKVQLPAVLFVALKLRVPLVNAADAVNVWLPAVLNVTLGVAVPSCRLKVAGSVAFVSLDVIATLSLTLVIKFQNASTALTVRLNAPPAACVAGVPVFPEAVPGAAV